MLTRLIKVATSRAPLAAQLGDALGLRARLKARALASDGLINSFWGVYQTAEEALAEATPSLAGDWNVVGLHADLSHQATLKHTMRLVGAVLRPGARVLDFGGGFGGLFFALRDAGHIPPRVAWRVVEVPAILPTARALAEASAARELSFSHVANGFEPDILIAAGYMQYVHAEAGDLFASLAAPPERVLINKVALTHNEPFWTLQNLGAANVAYRIYNREDFYCAVARAGYRIEERWDVPELSVEIPFHPEKRVAALSGVWLVKA